MYQRKSIDAKIFFGDICGLVAPSGGGKTAFAQNIVLWSGLDTLYVSPEVAAWQFNRRNIQILSGLGKKQIMKKPEYYWEQYKRNLDKVFCLEQPVSHKNLNDIVKQIMEICPKLDIHQVVFDHMKLMDWDSSEMRTAMEEFCRHIKPWAVNNDMIVWLINQVPKSAVKTFGSKKPKKIDITDTAEASGIYQISDVGISINTPMGINNPARKISVDKGRDMDAYYLQDLTFRQNKINFRFQPSTMGELRTEAEAQRANRRSSSTITSSSNF